MDTFVTNVAKESGVPSGIIQMILAMIASLLSGCPVPAAASLKTMATTNVGIITIYRAMRENGIRPLSGTGAKLLAAIQTESAKVSDADAATFLQVSS